jgi:Tfp pilus assembly protein PilN
VRSRSAYTVVARVSVRRGRIGMNRKKEEPMKKRGYQIVGVLGAVAIVGVCLALFAGQSSTPSPVTLQQVYDLLVTQDGKNRLDVLAARLDTIDAEIKDLDTELDLVHQVAQKMTDSQYGFFDVQKWTLDDIKYMLDSIQRQLDKIQDDVES